MSKVEFLRYLSGLCIGFFLGVQTMKVYDQTILTYIALVAIFVFIGAIYAIPISSKKR